MECRTILSVLHGPVLGWIPHMFVYMDYKLVASRNHEEHQRNLHNVLNVQMCKYTIIANK